MVHEVSATARMGAHPNGTWVKASDYEAALLRAEEAERKLAESEGYPGIAKDLEDCRTKLAAADAELQNWRTWGTIEVAIRNPSVSSSMDHWERRAESAESALTAERTRREGLEARIRDYDALAADRDRWQEDSMRQAATINRLAAAAEDRNEVDAKRRELHEADLRALAAERTRREAIEAALNDAIECVESWAAYANPYFREKHDLDGDLKRLCAALSSGKTEGDV
jgi:chromosome segregation ATPase